MKCRHCGADLDLVLLDLGTAPPSNAYLTAESVRTPETRLPLRILVCTGCWLVQTEDFAGREALFTADYAYFSSTSSSWRAHARGYVEDMIARFDLDGSSRVIEVASNDGYLLEFARARGIPCLGIEPTASTAAAARARGIETVEEFFGRALAIRLRDAGIQADLMVANNVLAHVPDLGDFVAGFPILLEPDGVVTFEFPHLLRMVEANQFDTAYHEHFSYLSFTVARTILEGNGLRVFDVDELMTHGGSLRVYAGRADTSTAPVRPSVSALLREEAAAGIMTAEFYAGFQSAAERVKNDFLHHLLDARRRGRRIGAFGAAAKGNTLLNFAGVRRDLIPYVVDASPGKVGRYLPGSHIPIVPLEHLRADRPDIIVVLPWNLEREITEKLSFAAEWNAELVFAVPRLRVVGPGAPEATVTEPSPLPSRGQG